jgi:hypothetical protein
MSNAADRVLERLRRTPRQGVTGVTPVTVAPVTPITAVVTPATPVTCRAGQPRGHSVTGSTLGVTPTGCTAAGAGILPASISHGVSRLCAMSAPSGFSAARWAAALNAVRVIATGWASQALSLGWKAEDLFGLNPKAPAARYDGMGLAFLLHPGDSVTLLTTNTAAIRTSSGSTLTYHRALEPTGSVLAWLLNAAIAPG